MYFIFDIIKEKNLRDELKWVYQSIFIAMTYISKAFCSYTCTITISF